MRKKLSLLLALAVILSSVSTVLAQGQGERNVICTQGYVQEITKGKVSVVGEGTYGEIVLNILPSTYIVDADSGKKISFMELRQGDKMAAYYSPIVTKSMPPQSNAIALVVGASKMGSPAKYINVAKLQENKDGSIRVLSFNDDLLVTIKPEIFTQPADIKTGSDLLVWYEVMTMSIPAHATATKVVLLNAKPDLVVYISEGSIDAKGKKLSLSTDENIEMDEYTLWLPLRVISENLGYSVVWHEESQEVELQKDANTVIAMTIGSKMYSGINGDASLINAPKLVDGKTLVPVEFFTNLLNLNVEVK